MTLELTALDMEILADRLIHKVSDRVEALIKKDIQGTLDMYACACECTNRDEYMGPDELTPILIRVLQRMLGKHNRSPCDELRDLHRLLREV